MFAITFYDTVLWLHITAVVVAFGGLFAYPVFLDVNARAPLAERPGFHRLQIAFSKKVTGPTIGVVLITGIYLATQRDQGSEPWVAIAFVMLLVIAGLGATVLRRAEQGMIDSATAGDEPAYAAALGSARLWTFVTLALVVFTIFDMTAKPFT